jgi:UDP-GlcNAc3NAcA epimerase
MKMVSIIGTRAQFIKAVPANRAIKSHNRQGCNPQITETLVHTGQHYNDDINQIFFDQLKIRKPTYNLGAGSGIMDGKMTGTVSAKIEAALLTAVFCILSPLVAERVT